MSAEFEPDAERAARDYLARELGSRAPRAVRCEAEFDEAPLDGEGRTAIYSFDLDAGGKPARHYVAAGRTVPNYFPAYGLDADDAYSLHVGTRFMLEVGVARVDAELEPPGAREGVFAFLRNHAPGAAVGSLDLAALFRCDDDYFAVYRLDVDGQPVYFMGADCPPGFYRMTEHPPQAALRLHLGKLLRREARDEAGHEPHPHDDTLPSA